MPKTEIKVSDDNIHVKDSYLYNKREIKSTVDEFYKSFPAMCCHSNRSKYSLGPDGIWRPKSTTIQDLAATGANASRIETGGGSQYIIGQAGTGANVGKVWNGNTWATQTYGQENAARAGMTNADGTGWDIAKRKEWMNSDEGKAYLASINNGQGLGFTADQYTGSAAQNRALFGAYRGFADWKANR